MRAPPPYPAFNVVSSAAFKPEKNLTVNHLINIEWRGGVGEGGADETAAGTPTHCFQMSRGDYGSLPRHDQEAPLIFGTGKGEGQRPACIRPVKVAGQKSQVKL